MYFKSHLKGDSIYAGLSKLQKTAVSFVDFLTIFGRVKKVTGRKTKEDAFYTNLEFGTAGMRGLIGAGTNRINIYVVRQATEGLARLIDEKGDEFKKRGVAIAYDSRHFTRVCF